MTETMKAEITEKGTEKPRCHMGSKSDNPCPREATERFRAEGTEPNMCAPHARACELGVIEDDLLVALDKLEEWVREAAAEVTTERLEGMMVKARDEAREEYARAHARSKAADLAADDHDGRITPEQSERLAALMIRADGFAGARTMLEDMPEERFRFADKWAIVDALARAANESSEEHEAYKREIGLLKPETIA